MFLQRNICFLSLMLIITITITTMFHNHTDHIVYTGWGHQKDVDNQIKQRWSFFLYLHLSSIFRHNVTHVLGQSLS